MYNIIYWIGIYSICTEIHDFIHWATDKRTKEIMEVYHNHKHKKEHIGFHADADRKIVNRIGFGERD